MTENTPQGWRDMADPALEQIKRDGEPVWLNDDGVDVQLYRWHKPWEDWTHNSCLIRPDAERNFTGWLPANVPDPDTGFADSLVVSEEMVDAAAKAWMVSATGDEIGWELHAPDIRVGITAALPHAKTVEQVREEVIEELADIAAERDILACVDVGGKRTGPNLADWLRSQKGQTND